MDLSKYPRPAFDTGMGIHGGANAWFPLGENGPEWAIGQLKEMGFTWVKLLDVEGSSLACIGACKAAGIEPVIRLYRPAPHTGTINAKTKEKLQLLIAAGAHYFETQNEPNVKWEWENEIIPPDAHEVVAMNWATDADTILAAGGIPLITAMSPGGEPGWDDIEFLRHMVWWLKDNWGLVKLNRCAIACHNAALNHPLDYPFDAINQSGENAGQKLLDPGASNGWNKYAAVHDLVLRETGLSLPVLSTEGGIWPGENQDPRYPEVTKQAVTNGYLQIRRAMSGGRYPDWYLCTGFWLMANRGMGNPHMPFEYQTWFNCDGVWIDAVAAYKVEPRVARPIQPPESPARILNDSEIAFVCREAGFTGTGLTLAVAIVLAESGGKTDALGINMWNDSRDLGIFQVNLPLWNALLPTDTDAFDPDKNAAAAFIISEGGMNWRPWSSFNANTHLQYMSRALAVTSQLPSPEQLKKFAYENCLGVPDESALMREARSLGLIPLSREVTASIDCKFTTGQVFGAGSQMALLYCLDGIWDRVYRADL
jgi:hypothetical protein